MKYSHYILKRKIEDVFIWPVIALGRGYAILFPLKKEYDIFFFFPFYHTGGAEKVHALITQVTGGSNCIVFFTRKSDDNNFLHDFHQSGCAIRNIFLYTDNKLFYFLNLLYRGIITGYINKQTRRPIVFNGQCNFGYKISPWVKKNIPQVELIHSFNTFSWIRIPFISFYRKTLMISKLRIEQHLQQYKDFEIPQGYSQRIMYIVNGIPLPDNVKRKDYFGSINILYVGRGTEEKRVHLVSAMAVEAAKKNLPATFMFMGNIDNAIPEEHKSYCTLLGHKKDAEEIDAIYQQAHVVIITSSTEGFPMVIEEGMARGCAVIATPVGDIPFHVRHQDNGFLFSDVGNETKIIQEGVAYIEQFCNKRHLLEIMSNNNIEYAKEHFSLEAFADKYKKLFAELTA